MKSIIVVEDNDLLRENICEILELEGYATHPAENGKVGWEKAQSLNPDLIVSDVNMPVMDGLQLLKEVRESDSLKQTPFIFLTVRNTMQELRLGMNYGADDYLAKPFDINHLINSVNTRLERKMDISESDIETVQKEGKHEMALKEFVKAPLKSLQKIGQDLQSENSGIHAQNAALGKIIEESSTKIETNLSKILTSMNLDNWEANGQIPQSMLNIITPDIKSAVIAELNQRGKKTSIHSILDMESAALKLAPDLIKIVTGEIIENALKFSDRFESVVVLGQVVSEDEYLLEVKNKGMVFPVERVSEIDTYRTFHDSQDHHNGIGLGLSNATRILTLCNCNYKIKTREGETTFQLFLKYIPAGQNQE